MSIARSSLPNCLCEWLYWHLTHLRGQTASAPCDFISTVQDVTILKETRAKGFVAITRGASSRTSGPSSRRTLSIRHWKTPWSGVHAGTVIARLTGFAHFVSRNPYHVSQAALELIRYLTCTALLGQRLRLSWWGAQLIGGAAHSLRPPPLWPRWMPCTWKNTLALVTLRLIGRRWAKWHWIFEFEQSRKIVLLLT